MEPITGFCDLCIPYTKNHVELKKVLTELCELGYKNVAIEQIYNDKEQKAEKNKRGADPFPTPVSLDFLSEFKGRLKIFNRLSIIYNDPSITYAMTNSVILKKYNIIAGRPTTDIALTHCCSTFNGDIITILPEDSDVLMSRKNYYIGVRRGMFFEIQYSDLITNSTNRKKIIARSHAYHAVGKSKNIIISSGATNLFQIRSPYDIANLGIIFGLSEEQSKYSILGQCRSLLIRADARRHGKSIMFIKQIENMPSDSDETDESDDDEDADADDVDKSNSDEEMEVQPKKRKKNN